MDNLNTLKDRLKNMITDEVSGVDKYKELAELIMQADGLTDKTKLLIAETFMGIRADEAKHRQLLKFVYSMLG